jgi:ABC-type transport system involved in multi-copper enzyme maturation permease subunit
MMIQIHAILLDSLRLLKSRSLFWLSLSLSVLAAVILFGTYSFNDKGMRILWFSTIENASLAAGTAGSKQFLAYMFNSIYVYFWLSWGAIILAVLSTASILPEFLSSGSIELSLAKPISRLSLLFWRVVGALLFVLLQTTVGVSVAYLLMGLKFGVWIHEALWTIPLITLQFFYLFCISTLLAVLTRSTLVCVIGTGLFWLGLFVIQFSSNKLTEVTAQTGRMMEIQIGRIETIKRRADEEQRPVTDSESKRIDDVQSQLDEVKIIHNTTERWAARMDFVEIFVPKTGDIQKVITKLAKAPTSNDFFSLLTRGARPPGGMDDEQFADAMDSGGAGQRAARQVETAKSIGSSLAFCSVCLLIAAIRFRRRDF